MSIKGDVVDYDESVTGERQAGAYFSLWSFCSKTAGGGLALLTGVALQVAGFVPNGAQRERVKWTLAILFSVLPATGLVFGWWLMGHFKLDEAVHSRVRTLLLQRSQSISVSMGPSKVNHPELV